MRPGASREAAPTGEQGDPVLWLLNLNSMRMEIRYSYTVIFPIQQENVTEFATSLTMNGQMKDNGRKSLSIVISTPAERLL